MAIYNATNENTFDSLLEFGLNPNIEYQPNNLGACALIHESDRIFDCIMSEIGALNEAEDSKKEWVEKIKAFFKRIKEFFIWIGKKIKELWDKFTGPFKDKIEKAIKKAKDAKNLKATKESSIIEAVEFPITIEYEGYEYDYDKMLSIYRDILRDPDYHNNPSMEDILKQLKNINDQMVEEIKDNRQDASNESIINAIRGSFIYDNYDTPVSSEEFDELFYKKFKGEKKSFNIKFNSIDDIIKELDVIIKDLESIKSDDETMKQLVTFSNNNLDKSNKMLNELERYFTNPDSLSQLSPSNREFMKSYAVKAINIERSRTSIAISVMDKIINLVTGKLNQTIGLLNKVISVENQILGGSTNESYLSKYLNNVVID